MKDKDLLDVFSLVDERYVEEADPDKKKIALVWKKLAYFVAAACLLLAMTLPIVFMGGDGGIVPVPPQDSITPLVGQTTQNSPSVLPPITTPSIDTDTQVPTTVNPLDPYKDSEYYPVIEKIDKYFDRSNDSAKPADTALPSLGVDGVNDHPKDITDNQVEGVVEADRIKRTATHIFYSTGNRLDVYTIAGQESVCVASYTVEGYISGFYLLENGKALVFSQQSGTVLTLLDVSNLQEIQKISELRVTGYDCTSRLADGTVLLFTEYRIHQKPDYSHPETFVPTAVYNDESPVSIPIEDLVLPRLEKVSYYYAIYLLDAETLAIQDAMGFFGPEPEVYVSEKHVFVSLPYTDNTSQTDQNKVLRTTKATSDIYCLSYGENALEQKGVFTLEGWAKDQYSFDEKDGVLRVVTQIDHRASAYIDGTPVLEDRDYYYGASLYCVSLESFTIVGRVERFAPKYEQVRSVRFDGDYAYVCTSLEMRDPVFFFDLSELWHITYTHTGEIDGYSFSLVDFGNGALLGIGYEDLDELAAKIEVYREEGNQVISVDSFILSYTMISFEYKEYYVDRENQLLGFAAISGRNDYILLHFNGEELVELMRVEHPGSFSSYRAVMIDGYLYLFSSESFQVLEVNIE